MAKATDERTVAVLKAATEQKEIEKPVEEVRFVFSSTGVVLKGKKVPPLLMQDIVREYPEPPVPTVYYKDDDKEIPNPNDPDYLKALEQRNNDMANALTDVLLALGTEVISVPDDMPLPDDDSWIATREMFLKDAKIPREGLGRYLAWIKYVAITDAEDLNDLATQLKFMTGIAYEEVANTAEGFPGEGE